MDTVKMINRLKSAGVEFAEGMTARELDLAEACFQFRFPTEIRAFLSCAMPVGDSSFDAAVIAYLEGSPKLIPFYAHRCFFDGMDGMPIVSFWQPVDSILHGRDFENYLACEFLGGECDLAHVSERMKQTGIWYEVLSFPMIDSE